MINKSESNVHWLECELLLNVPGLVHGMFLRHGGVSQGPYSSLNVGENCGDRSFHVQTNRKKIARLLKLSRLAIAKQVHGIALGSVNAKEAHDGLVTQKKQVGLLISHADCQAAIIVDPIHQVIANVHSGWRGSVQNIYGHTIAHFCKVYGSKPENLLVAISPSLGPENSEFRNYKTELPESFWPYQIKPFYFDFWAITEAQLKTAGILPHHIQIARICTYNNEDCFSYRREKITGRHATVVGWQ